MTRSALIVWGGWDGHQPKEVGELFQEMLVAEGFDIEMADSLEAFEDQEKIAGLSLIVPVWTMSDISEAQRGSVTRAVSEFGVGLAGCHGGMCDAFRKDTEWQFMTGGQWVAHPGNDGVRYVVNISHSNPHPITDGIEDFEIVSEQYYLHTDPGNNVLATTQFPWPGIDGPHVANACAMPQVWTKMYGKGRVFYNALGHQRNVIDQGPAFEIMKRGFLWAARP